METNWRIVLDNSQERIYHRRFSKRKDKTAIESGGEVRVCSWDNLTDEDKRGRSIECGKIFCKSGPKSVLVRNNNGEMVKRTLKMLRRFFKELAA